MGATIVDSALCALGGTAPNPVLTTIRYFREEYEEHIKNKRCPAGACKGLFELWIDPDRCIGCGQCLTNCPSSAVSGEKKNAHTLDTGKCIQCGICREICPTNAVRVK
jgi:NADH-quinone oxidoreductase subunit F